MQSTSTPLHVLLLRLLVVSVLLLGLFWFRGSPFAAVIAPNGDETFVATQPLEVKWTSGNPGIREIQLVPAVGGSSISVYKTDAYGYPVPDTSGSFTFIPAHVGAPSGSYYIKIYYANSSSVFDMSDRPFSVVSSLPAPAIPSSQSVSGTPTITVLSPNGSEQFMQGTVITARWFAVNAPSHMKINVTLYKSRVHPVRESVCSGGVCTESTYEWVANIAHMSDNDGIESWTIPSSIPSDSIYYVRIACNYPPGTPYQAGCKTDDSDLPFQIGAVIISPPPTQAPSSSSIAVPTPRLIPTPSPFPRVSPSEPKPSPTHIPRATSLVSSPQPEVINSPSPTPTIESAPPPSVEQSPSFFGRMRRAWRAVWEVFFP